MPIRLLPENIRLWFVEDAKYLLNDLQNNRLTMVLVPAPEPKHVGHMIRVADSQNH